MPIVVRARGPAQAWMERLNLAFLNVPVSLGLTLSPRLVRASRSNGMDLAY
jgi:hypothetical protein